MKSTITKSGFNPMLVVLYFTLFLALVVCVQVVSFVFEARRLNPIFETKTYEEFVRIYKNKIVGQREAVVSDERYRILRLERSNNPICFPSGFPSVVFNSKGEMIDCCADDGDNDRFIRKWRGDGDATAKDVEWRCHC